VNACILKIIEDEIKRLEDIDNSLATIETDEDFAVHFITNCELKALRKEYNKLLCDNKKANIECDSNGNKSELS
jgi:hypothetical protein